MSESYHCLKFENECLSFMNQVKLPLIEEYVVTDNYERIAEAIEKLEIRGAPAIGIAAAYALAFSMKEMSEQNVFETAFSRLASTRPTAVNLFWALNSMKKVYLENKEAANIYEILKNEAVRIHNDDIEKCFRIGENGLSLFKKKTTVLTHCNTGKLATGGNGTAFNVILSAFNEGLVELVYADETRPLLQGSRLTAFELDKCGIPFKIVPDSAAAFLMKQGKIGLAVTGADRIAANGDSANKIGTYSLAVNCKYHKIPFYIAAPTSTIDINSKTGSDIVIEERKKSELTEVHGNEITKNTFDVYNPAFDVTPAELITGIITEETVFSYPYNFKNV